MYNKDSIDLLTKTLNISYEMNNNILDGICSFGLIFFDNLSKVKLNADGILFSEIVSAWFFALGEIFLLQLTSVHMTDHVNDSWNKHAHPFVKIVWTGIDIFAERCLSEWLLNTAF